METRARIKAYFAQAGIIPNPDKSLTPLNTNNPKQFVVYTNRVKKVPHLRKPTTLITMYDMKVDDKHVGHIGIEVDKDNRYGKISDLVVFPDFRRKGYANQLMTHVLEKHGTMPLILNARPKAESNNISLDELVQFYGCYDFLPFITKVPGRVTMLRLPWLYDSHREYD